MGKVHDIARQLWVHTYPKSRLTFQSASKVLANHRDTHIEMPVYGLTEDMYASAAYIESELGDLVISDGDARKMMRRRGTLEEGKALQVKVEGRKRELREEVIILRMSIGGMIRNATKRLPTLALPARELVELGRMDARLGQCSSIGALCRRIASLVVDVAS